VWRHTLASRPESNYSLTSVEVDRHTGLASVCLSTGRRLPAVWRYTGTLVGLTFFSLKKSGPLATGDSGRVETQILADQRDRATLRAELK